MLINISQALQFLFLVFVTKEDWKVPAHLHSPLVSLACCLCTDWSILIPADKGFGMCSEVGGNSHSFLGAEKFDFQVNLTEVVSFLLLKYTITRSEFVKVNQESSCL